MRDRIMKMDGIEKGFYAHLHVPALRDQTEGISNKYRMPQKCTLPPGGWGGRGWIGTPKHYIHYAFGLIK